MLPEGNWIRFPNIKVALYLGKFFVQNIQGEFEIAEKSIETCVL